MDGRLLGWVPVPPRRARALRPSQVVRRSPRLDLPFLAPSAPLFCSSRPGRWPTPSPLGLSPAAATASDGASEFDGSAFAFWYVRVAFSTLFLWGPLVPVSAVCRRRFCPARPLLCFARYPRRLRCQSFQLSMPMPCRFEQKAPENVEGGKQWPSGATGLPKPSASIMLVLSLLLLRLNTAEHRC